MSEQRPLSPMEQIRRAYEETEQRTSRTMEELVSSQGFAEALSMLVGNAMSMSRISGNVIDDVLRRTHIAGRSDLAGVGRQIGRTEDKLELVLQRIEALEDEVRALRADLAGSARSDTEAREADSASEAGRRSRRTSAGKTSRTSAGKTSHTSAVAAVTPTTSVTASAPPSGSGEGA